MKIKLHKLLAIFMSVILMAGCADVKPTDSEKTETLNNLQSNNQQNDENKGKILTIGAGRSFYEGPGKVNFLHKSTNVWESLTYLNNDMEVEPCLAESMTMSSDGLTWTVKLAQGVMFHDGTVLDAETAKRNLDRNYHFSPKEKKYVKEYENVRDMGKIESIDVIDKYTLTVKHSKCVPDFDSRLSYANGEMFSIASFGDDGVITVPYGTGPMMYDSYDEQTKILKLKAFANYRKGKPNIDAAIFKNIGDADTRLAALRSGDIDVVSDVGAIMPHQAQIILSDQNLVLKKQNVSTNHYFHFNTCEGKLFNSKELRNAVSMAIDRQTIVDTLLEGYGVAGTSVITPVAKKWYVNVGYTYDVQKSSELAQNVLKGDVKDATLLLNSATTGRWPYQDVAVLTKEQLSKIGINVNIELVDGASWAERVKEGSYDITIAPYTITTGEPNFFFEPHMSSTGSMNEGRSYGYKNQSVDELIEKASYEPNADRRAEYYSNLQQIAADEGPVVPIWHDVTLYAMNKNVKNFNIDINFWPDLFEVDIEDADSTK